MGTASETRIGLDGFGIDHNRAYYLMAVALGQRDPYTHAHAQRVAAYSRRLSERTGIGGEDLRAITMGGMLHDVGKLGLSDRIFSNKQAALSKEMLGEVQSHPLIGAQLLSKFNCPKAIIDVVLGHHERIDGSGYPFGLAGGEIPLGAKIVSVADCFDAITTDRPYQRRKSLAHAFIIMKDMAGTCLDAELTDLMIREIQANGTESILPVAPISMPLLQAV
ncbi:MAG: HD domain-containing protein [Desulfobacterales bacterium]|nr:HD domain-containing protein [Desulfobacterales bacterium]